MSHPFRPHIHTLCSRESRSATIFIALSCLVYVLQVVTVVMALVGGVGVSVRLALTVRTWWPGPFRESRFLTSSILHILAMA